MPWKAQLCRFCEIQYTNKTGLRNHLSWYTGEWRFPADGIHDVLKIQEILDSESKNRCQYQCPSCLKIIESRQSLIDHVFNRKHYGSYDRRIRNISKARRYSKAWPFRFEEEEVKVTQRKGVFPFLHLPFELRHMIYKLVLFFGTIRFERGIGCTVDPARRQGIWLQHNPHWYLLGLLAVNHQTYDEGRQVFYSLNSFIFKEIATVPIFVIGIGRENAGLLRSVQWEDVFVRCENWIDGIRLCLMRMEEVDAPEANILDVWNNEELYQNFLRAHSAIPPHPFSFSLLTGHRLLRLDTTNALSDDFRVRYSLDVTLGKENVGYSTKIDRKRTVSFELYVRNDEKMWWVPSSLRDGY